MARSIEVVLELDNKQYNRAIKQSQSQTKGFESSTVASASRVAGAFAAIGGTAILRSIINVGSTFQDLQNSLNVVFGSVEEGAVAFERVKDFAQNTQFSVETLTQAFVQLKGAGVEPTEELLLTFANTASVTTDQMGTFQAALDLVTRSTAGGLGLEDLNRLADRGIPVFTILQDKLNLTRLEVSKFGKTAEGANKIISALTGELQNRFGDALDNSSDNLSRLTNNLGDSLSELQNALFGLIEADLTEGIKALANAINSMTAGVKTLQTELGGLSSTFYTVLAVVAFIFNPFQKLKLAFQGVKLAGKGLVGTLKTIGQTIAKVFPFIKGLSDRVSAFVGVMTLGIIANGNYIKMLKRLRDKIFGVSNEVDGMTGAMKRNEEAQKAFDERQKAAAESAKALAAEITELTSVASSFVGNDYRTELEKITDRQDKARQALFDLRMAFVKSNGDIENYQQLLAAVKNEIIAADSAFSDYNESLKDPAQETFLEFMKRMDDALLNYNTEQKNATQLLEQMNEALALGYGDAEDFAFIIERLNSILGISEEETKSFSETLSELKDEIEAGTGGITQYNLLLDTLRQFMEDEKISFIEFTDLVRDLDEAFMQNEGLNNFVDLLGTAQVALSEDLATAFLEGEKAGDAFKNFFKKMITQIIADIIRLQVMQPIIQALMGAFGMPGKFGANGKFTLNGRANGGPVMPGGTYLIGEKGPELLQMGSQGGNVIPNHEMGGGGGGGQVTYNINAVDAPSFQQLVASDPQFIYAVTQAGARTVPGAR